MRFKIVIGNGLGLLQMVSEPDIERCVVGTQGGRIVRSYIDGRGEQSYKNVETSP